MNQNITYLKMLIKMDLNMKTKTGQRYFFKRKNFPKHIYVATNYTTLIHTTRVRVVTEFTEILYQIQCQPSIILPTLCFRIYEALLLYEF